VACGCVLYLLVLLNCILSSGIGICKGKGWASFKIELQDFEGDKIINLFQELVLLSHSFLSHLEPVCAAEIELF